MVATATDRRQERRDAKSARIVAEAWTLAHRDGLAAISLRDLAEAVGLRQPSLYVYFSSKLDLYDAMFAEGYQQFLDTVQGHHYSADPDEALAEFVALCVQFSSDDIVRHQLLAQRTIPGFEPSPDSWEIALEFYAFATGLLKATGVEDQEDIDVFSALIAGLNHQQIANDPGGTRWVARAGQVTEMFLIDHRRRRESGTRGAHDET